jgi:hypothetical protein
LESYMLMEAVKTRVVSCSREVSGGSGLICIRERLVTSNAGRFYDVCRILQLSAAFLDSEIQA